MSSGSLDLGSGNEAERGSKDALRGVAILSKLLAPEAPMDTPSL